MKDKYYSFLSVYTVAQEPKRLLANVKTPEGVVLKVYEVTPSDRTPIAVKDPEDVLEPVPVSGFGSA